MVHSALVKALPYGLLLTKFANPPTHAAKYQGNTRTSKLYKSHHLLTFLETNLLLSYLQRSPWPIVKFIPSICSDTTEILAFSVYLQN